MGLEIRVKTFSRRRSRLKDKFSPFIPNILVPFSVHCNPMLLGPIISQIHVTIIHRKYITPNLLIVFTMCKENLHTLGNLISFPCEIWVSLQYTRNSQPFCQMGGDVVCIASTINDKREPRRSINIYLYFKKAPPWVNFPLNH